MATLRKDGRYQATYMDPNGKRKTVYGQSEEEAEALKARVQRGIPSISSAKAGTLHDVAKRSWFPTYEQTARPNTVRRYNECYTIHVRPAFGDFHPSEITRAMIQMWVNEKLRKFAPNSVAMMRGVLSMVLEHAREDGLVNFNPASKVKVPRGAKRVRVMTVEVARITLEALSGSELACPFFLAAILGLRRGEVCALKWRQLDMDARRVSITEQRIIERGAIRGKGTREGLPKSGTSKRSFVLPESLWQALLDRGNLDHGYLCTHHGKPWNPEKLTWEWAKAREGLGLTDWHFHDLRHGAAGILAALNVDLLTIAAILGHGQINVTLLYAASQDATATRGFEKVGNILFPIGATS